MSSIWKGEEICFDCGAYQDVATLQDLDSPPENVEKNRYQYLAMLQDLDAPPKIIIKNTYQYLATSQGLEIHF